MWTSTSLDAVPARRLLARPETEMFAGKRDEGCGFGDVGG